MKKIKIVYYTDSKVVGGAERYLYLLLKNINKKRYKTFLIHPNTPEHNKWAQGVSMLGVTALPLGFRNIYRPSLWSKLYRTFKQINPDIIHFQFWSPYCCGPGLMCAKSAKNAIIFSTEHSYVPLSEASLFMRPIKSWYLKWRQNIIDYPTTVSDASRIMMKSSQFFIKKKITTIHNGIEIKECGRNQTNLEKKIDWRKINAVTVARLAKGKGQDSLIEAVHHITNKNVIFHLIGDGPETKTLKHLAKTKGLNKRIIFWGHRVDVQKLLPNFHLFVFPSETENFPFAILEAMAAGLPIVSSNVGGIQEAVIQNKGGLLICPNKPTQLAKNINSLIAKPQMIKKMGQFNSQLVRAKFSDKIMTQSTSHLYEYALRKHKN